ncbi:hypothetical protein RRF57_013405 [Xylaria bambusicola]|uniref:Uncharacterized protein n=1 Tax=Xylaria bambusicola TaxID=326684 RepID=A0AAN7URQ9_9PEZI
MNPKQPNEKPPSRPKELATEATVSDASSPGIATGAAAADVHAARAAIATATGERPVPGPASLYFEGSFDDAADAIRRYKAEHPGERVFMEWSATPLPPLQKT